MIEFFFGVLVGGFGGICFMASCFIAGCHDCMERGPSRGE